MQLNTSNRPVNQAALTQWSQLVHANLPHLSAPQARLLAWWSFGIVLIGHCGLSSVAFVLATLLHQAPNTLRQRLREWYYEAEAKKGSSRRQLEVASCFGPLLGWVCRHWHNPNQQLTLVIDATTLQQRFVILSLSVVYRACAIPVAWKVLEGAGAGSWQPHWLKMLQECHGFVPSEWTVLVLADRGLYARWLYQQIVELGWHPMLRINQQKHVQYRRVGGQRWCRLSRLVQRPGQEYGQAVELYRSRVLKCTLLGGWQVGCRESWLVVTDLGVQEARVQWYGYRSWIECGFKDLKRGGWQWQGSRMQRAERVERMWLALAVATLWVVNVGSEVEDNQVAVGQEAGRKAVRRELSVFRQGSLYLRVALVRGLEIKLGWFKAARWPRGRTIKRLSG